MLQFTVKFKQACFSEMVPIIYVIQQVFQGFGIVPGFPGKLCFKFRIIERKADAIFAAHMVLEMHRYLLRQVPVITPLEIQAADGLYKINRSVCQWLNHRYDALLAFAFEKINDQQQDQQ